MSFVIVGVDAGGTRTTAAALGERGEPTVVRGEGANLVTLGSERAAQRIAALARAALGGARADALVVGAAGAWNPDIAAELRQELTRATGIVNVEVTHDARIALRAAVPDGDGIVVIAGTGSIAYGEIGATHLRAGGFGHLLGDEGSGYAIGAAALRLTLRALDERSPRDALVEEVLRGFEAADACGLLARVHAESDVVAAIASLAPSVIALAGSGERSAQKIVQQAALDLADLVKTVVKRAALRDGATPIACSGGLLRENSLLSYLLETRLSNECPAMPIVKGGPPPYHGALALARRMLATA